jgi:hypothetical protein
MFVTVMTDTPPSPRERYAQLDFYPVLPATGDSDGL